MDILMQKAREIWDTTYQTVEKSLLSVDTFVKDNVFQSMLLSFAFGVLLSLLAF